MHCPFCRHPDSRVIDSRTSDDGLSIRRRRQCPECGGRFSTIETASLNVIKRSGVIEPFSREKVMSGVRKACQGRPVTEADLAVLAQKVEETVRQTGVVADRHERDRPRDPRPAARARRGRLPALRERLPGVRLARGLRVRDRAAARRPPAALTAAPIATASAAASRIAWTGCIPSSSAPSSRAWTPRPPTTPRWSSSGCWAIPPFSWVARALTAPGAGARDVGARTALRLAVRRRRGLRQGRARRAGPARARLRPRRGRHAHRDPAGRQPAAAAVPAHPRPRRRQPHGLQQRRRRGRRRAARRSCAAARSAA